mmetsp:Transcript_32969/g.52826  ORF Transcript_32969/g.52826 Transcript_32969/m.52826 type:complete len:92 (-) Transcript_32969:248-523(-)
MRYGDDTGASVAKLEKGKGEERKVALTVSSEEEMTKTKEWRKPVAAAAAAGVTTTTRVKTTTREAPQAIGNPSKPLLASFRGFASAAWGFS